MTPKKTTTKIPNKKTPYNTFKGEHIDDFDRTFIEKGK